MRCSLKLGVVTAIFAFATLTFATDISFTYSGSGFTGSGVFTAIDQGGGTYLVTGVNGQQNGMPFSGVEPVTPQLPGWAYNNLAYLNSTPQLDIDGVLLDWSGGGVVNLFYDSGFNGGSYALENSPTEYAIDFSASATPEPNTLLMSGSGLIGLAGLARKRLFS